MVNAIFDDVNGRTRDLWRYPDTLSWDAERHTNELVLALDDYWRHGLNAITYADQRLEPSTSR